jgi:hypothetical protein
MAQVVVNVYFNGSSESPKSVEPQSLTSCHDRQGNRAATPQPCKQPSSHPTIHAIFILSTRLLQNKNNDCDDRSFVAMTSHLITKRALLPPKSRTTASYTEAKEQRTNNLAFDDTAPKSKAAKAARKRESLYCTSLRLSMVRDFDACHAYLAKEFDSSMIVSPLLDPRVLERRVMAAKAGDRTTR